MADNVIDFNARKKPPAGGAPSVAKPPELDPYENPPFLTVSFYEGEGGPVRMRGAFNSPNQLREAARRILECWVTMMNAAYVQDQDWALCPRALFVLNHSGAFDIHTFNGSGDGGNTTKRDFEWMKAALPAFKHRFDQFIEQAPNA